MIQRLILFWPIATKLLVSYARDYMSRVMSSNFISGNYGGGRHIIWGFLDLCQNVLQKGLQRLRENCAQTKNTTYLGKSLTKLSCLLARRQEKAVTVL